MLHSSWDGDSINFAHWNRVANGCYREIDILRMVRLGREAEFAVSLLLTYPPPTCVNGPAVRTTRFCLNQPW